MMQTIRRGAPAVPRALALASLLVCASLAGAVTPKAVPAELPAETLTSGAIAASAKERVYVADIAIAHISDGRIRVFDARRGTFLGMVSTAYAGNFTVSNGADELYVATTHLSRSTRGERADVLEVYDTANLGFKYEVLLPAKRAQALNYRGLVRASGNGRFVFVQNATPATSVTVVDLAQRKVTTEVPTPGCWGILPAAGHGSRFSMLCGDGKVATVTLDEQGQPVDRQLSEKLFDADTDAWFHTAERIGDRFFFISFKGVITELDLSGPVAAFKGSRNIVGPADAKLGWRPGGYQAFAVHPSGHHAVVAMHDKGGEGTHKMPAKQLWVVSLDTGKRVATVPGRNTVSLTFSRTGARLQALDGVAAALNVWDWDDAARQPMTFVGTTKPVGMASVQLESHD